MSYLLKWPNGNPPKIQAVVKTIGCSPQTPNNASLLKTTSIQLIEHREVEQVPIQRLHSYVLVSLV